MARGLYVKTDGGSPWSQVKQLFVKTGTAWETVKDAWVKVTTSGTGAWVKFFTAGTRPSSDVEILQTWYGYNSDSVRFQGKNYPWSPVPSTLKYYFKWISPSNVTTYLNASGSSGDTATNPTTFNTYPSSTTYISISPSGTDYDYPGVNSYVFEVRATTPNGVSTSTPYEIRTPAAPTLSYSVLTSTSVRLTINSATNADYIATGRYIVYTYDSTSGYIYSGGGRGGYAASTTSLTVDLTGLTAGRQYFVYVLPVTGTAGARPFVYNSTSETSGYSGYRGQEASLEIVSSAEYTFSFGNTIYVASNGYIGLGSVPDTGSDSIPSSGKFLGIIPMDLQNASNTSVWYWSDTSQYVIRWEGYNYNSSGDTKIWQVTFYNGQSYADVKAITVSGTTSGTSAYVNNGTVKSSYPSVLSTGSSYRVSFDTSAPTVVSITEKSKAIMKQITSAAYTGSLDRGYATLVSATNQNGFTAGTVKVTGGSTETASGSVTTGATLNLVTNNDWPSGTTFTYQWKKTRDINALPPINSGTAASQAVSTVGEQYYCEVSYSNSGVTGTITSNSYLVVPAAPTYTLTNNGNGTFTISSVASTGGSYYYGTWKVGTTGTETAIARTALATNTTITSGAGTIYVVLYSSQNVTYSGDPASTARNSWEHTDTSVEVTNVTLVTGAKRSINTGITFTNSSTTLYVSTNGYIGYSTATASSMGSISFPTSGSILNIFGSNDLSQTNTSGTTQNVTYKNGSSYFAVHWIGRYLGSSTETLEYEARFYWNSDLVEVYSITNNLSGLHSPSNTAILTSNSVSKTWSANSSAMSSWTLESGMTSGGAPTSSDDGYTTLTPTKPVIKGTGTKRIIPLGVTVTSASTIAYVSTNGFIGINSDPGTVFSIPSTGRYLSILTADLRQTALYTSATSTTYNIRYQGTLLGDAAQVVDYEVKFTFGSTSAEVYIITNGLTATPDDNTLYVNGVGSNTWSAASTSTMTAAASTANTTNNNVDDARTAITLTASGGGGGGTTTRATSITYVAPTTTAVNTTVLSSGSVDDGYYSFTLPFTMYFNGTAYSTIHVGTNSYVTFGTGATNFSGLGASTPAYDKIMVDAGDRGSSGVYWTSSASSWTMRYEGSSGTTGSPIAIIWEITGSSTNNKRIRLSIKQVASGGVTGMYSSSALISSLGGASTSWNIDSA